MPVPIMIELAGGGVSSPSAAAMIEACNASARRACEIVESTPADSDAVARVAWKGTERLQAVVRVGLGRGDRRRWEAREIEFKPADDMAERWRSVGLIIGALATVDEPDPVLPDKPESPKALSRLPGEPMLATEKRTTN